MKHWKLSFSKKKVKSFVYSPDTNYFRESLTRVLLNNVLITYYIERFKSKSKVIGTITSVFWSGSKTAKNNLQVIYINISTQAFWLVCFIDVGLLRISRFSKQFLRTIYSRWCFRLHGILPKTRRDRLSGASSATCNIIICYAPLTRSIAYLFPCSRSFIFGIPIIRHWRILRYAVGHILMSITRFTKQFIITKA